MDSKKLSARLKQPGHDQTFKTSEGEFVRVVRSILSPELYEVADHPKDLAKMFGGRFGVVPEASIRCRKSNKVIYFEVKKQGPNGNAEERACKHHTVQFQKALKEFLGYDNHPFFTVMCENLARDERYTLKHPYYFEPGQYFLWVDYAHTEDLKKWVVDICRKFLG